MVNNLKYNNHKIKVKKKNEAINNVIKQIVR